MSVPESGRMRAGVVGAGHMGQYHILALAELWDVELVGICDADVDRAEQIAAQYGTRAVATHQELAGLDHQGVKIGRRLAIAAQFQVHLGAGIRGRKDLGNETEVLSV